MATGNVRLACSECDRCDKDNVTLEHFGQCEAEGWTDITEFQSFEAACRTFDNPADAPPGHDVTAWYTHIGLCPDCQN